MPRRHSQNNTASAIFTHYEKKQLKDYGTQKKRLNRDCFKPFDACSICLQAVLNPLADKEGHIYCKTCIYQYMLDQKKAYKTKLKQYNQYIKSIETDEKNKEKQKEDKVKENFEEKESRILNVTEPKAKNSSDPKLKSFWLPSLTPTSIPITMEKPSKTVKSPFGGILKLKDLVPLNLTPIDEKEEENNIKSQKTGRYMCPTCNKSLNNVTGVTCIKTTGRVFCKNCMENIIKKDMVCPITSSKFLDNDLLTLEAEGSSFAGRSGEKLEAVKVTPFARL